MLWYQLLYKRRDPRVGGIWTRINSTFCLPSYQCSGSGSAWSICFWASWIRIRNIFVRIWILPWTSKKIRNNLDSTVSGLLCNFLSLKNDVNSKRNKQDLEPDPHADLCAKGTDPRIRIKIRTKCHIRTTASYSFKGLYRERFVLPFYPVYSMTDEIEV